MFWSSQAESQSQLLAVGHCDSKFVRYVFLKHAISNTYLGKHGTKHSQNFLGQGHSLKDGKVSDRSCNRNPSAVASLWKVSMGALEWRLRVLVLNCPWLPTLVIIFATKIL